MSVQANVQNDQGYSNLSVSGTVVARKKTVAGQIFANDVLTTMLNTEMLTVNELITDETSGVVSVGDLTGTGLPGDPVTFSFTNTEFLHSIHISDDFVSPGRYIEIDGNTSAALQITVTILTAVNQLAAVMFRISKKDNDPGNMVVRLDDLTGTPIPGVSSVLNLTGVGGDNIAAGNLVYTFDSPLPPNTPFVMHFTSDNSATIETRTYVVGVLNLV
jgi:hypothetical protein